MTTKIEIEGAKRADSWMVPPEALVIKGLDDGDTTHPLAQKGRNALPIDAVKVHWLMERGLTSDILVQKDGDHWLVVDGRQRVRAAREANRKLSEAGAPPLMVRIRHFKGDEVGAMQHMLTSNTYRNDDAWSDNAETARRLIDVHNQTPADVAKLFNVTAATVQRMIRFTELSAPVKAAVRNGQITATAALELVDLPRAEQTTRLEPLLKAIDPAAKSRKAKVSSKAAKKAAGKKDKAPGKKQIVAWLKANDGWECMPGVVSDFAAWVIGEGQEPEMEHAEDAA